MTILRGQTELTKHLELRTENFVGASLMARMSFWN